ncbi:RHS repeat domain-containing protein [Flavobacterium crassostreae]|uniref:Teneurin-like YD-shell domain-containing protein n=2 Tax=Flavobacterium crassostreae TaxID=1763534 RepID=A0A1B9DQ43_9FLAO|nr:RHS repeat-associated core domain-containing protein [Flavobacterium crassostreae]OCB71797.1 hypothetical protein LPBF_11435 [Flavobacterium crassostreae]
MHQYEYDSFYRLKTAKAVYQGEFTKASYELNMGYNHLHNITNKNLVHTVNNEQKGYVLDYNYDNEQHPNAPSSINEVTQATTGGIRNYVYDGNGNPTSYTEQQSFRKMSWDEENRLMGINDTGRMHQYTYDAGGERVIKSSGDSQNVAVNGQTAATIVHTNDYTGYVSPYFVISKGKFTKHYFEGACRIVSKLGNGAFAQPLGITAGGVNYTQRTAEQQMALDNYVRTLGVPPGPPTQQGIYATPEFTGDPYPSDTLKAVEENQEPPEGWPRNPVFNAPGDVPGPPVQFGDPVKPSTVRAGEGFTGIGLPEKDIFYFHPDHLGSTSYISSGNGSISQHVEYIAFGEVLFEEHSSSFSSPYLFNGKELDRETNLSYYGARYLDMKTSLWLNVDPLAEKFYNNSPYIYVSQNPINLIDPTGMGEESVGSDPPKKSWAGRAVETVKNWFGGSSSNNSATKTKTTVTAGPINDDPSFFKQFLLATPVLGATINSSDKMGEGNYAGAAADFGVGVLDLFTLGAANKYKVGSEVVIGSAEKAMANEGVTVIGEGMARVEAVASKIPGSKILNTMPKFTGTADQVTSQMMQYNRQWILNEMRSGGTILDIGRDVTRANPSIFYQMEQNMMKNYKLLHP